MSDHSELKKLAEATKLESINSVQRDRLIVHFQRAASPAAVLALIAENKRLAIREDVLENLCDARFRINLDLETERDKLKAEVERITALNHAQFGDAIRNNAERDQLKAEVEALRKDKDRLDALEANFWDVRHISTQVGMEGDTSESIEIVGSWMDAPRERVIGENYNENLRAAIDQAMKAPAYPPARPEYEYEIPDFGGGNGNKARRRAGELGIDYDAAMGKGEKA